MHVPHYIRTLWSWCSPDHVHIAKGSIPFAACYLLVVQRDHPDSLDDLDDLDDLGDLDMLIILVILICCDGDDVDYKINHRRPGPGGDLKHGCMGDGHSIIIILLTLMTYMSLLMTMIREAPETNFCPKLGIWPNRLDPPSPYVGIPKKEKKMCLFCILA